MPVEVCFRKVAPPASCCGKLQVKTGAQVFAVLSLIRSVAITVGVVRRWSNGEAYATTLHVMELLLWIYVGLVGTYTWVGVVRSIGCCWPQCAPVESLMKVHNVDKQQRRGWVQWGFRYSIGLLIFNGLFLGGISIFAEDECQVPRIKQRIDAKTRFLYGPAAGQKLIRPEADRGTDMFGAKVLLWIKGNVCAKDPQWIGASCPVTVVKGMCSTQGKYEGFPEKQSSPILHSCCTPDCDDYKAAQQYMQAQCLEKFTGRFMLFEALSTLVFVYMAWIFFGLWQDLERAHNATEQPHQDPRAMKAGDDGRDVFRDDDRQQRGDRDDRDRRDDRDGGRNDDRYDDRNDDRRDERGSGGGRAEDFGGANDFEAEF